MNREIKFRMWNNVEDKPERSRYFYDEYDVFECLKQQALFNKNPKDKLGYDHVGDGNSFEQFTGIQDKNGKDIYEGDIMKIILEGLGFWEKQKDLERIGKVVYNEDYAGYLVVWEYSKDQHHENLSCDLAFTGEILGNVYENPEFKKLD